MDLESRLFWILTVKEVRHFLGPLKDHAMRAIFDKSDLFCGQLSKRIRVDCSKRPLLNTLCITDFLSDKEMSDSLTRVKFYYLFTLCFFFREVLLLLDFLSVNFFVGGNIIYIFFFIADINKRFFYQIELKTEDPPGEFTLNIRLIVYYYS